MMVKSRVEMRRGNSFLSNVCAIARIGDEGMGYIFRAIVDQIFVLAARHSRERCFVREAPSRGCGRARGGGG